MCISKSRQTYLLGTATVVYTDALEWRSRKFLVFDLASSVRLFENQLQGEPLAIRCSSKTIAFVVQVNHDYYEIHIYAWDGAAALLTRILPRDQDSNRRIYPQLSRNGVLAYRSFYNHAQVDFYDTHAVSCFPP